MSFNYEFVSIPVLSTALKEGIKTAENEVRCAVQSVMRFLFKGKSDAAGKLKELSDSKVIQRKNGSGVPMFKSELESFQKSRLLQCATIVSFVNMRSLRIFNKGDLKVSSKDLNCCDFAVQLGMCLAETSPTIYFDCDELNKRGLNRLLDLLADIKKMFDSRLLVILLSQSALRSEILEFSEKEFCISEPTKKKAKMESNCEFLDGEVKDVSMERDKMEEKRDLEIYELKRANENLQKVKDYYQDKYEGLKEEHETSLKKELENETILRDLKKENETIVGDNNRLLFEKKSVERNKETRNSEIESSIININKLKMENKSVVMDNDRLKTENAIIAKDFNRVKMTYESVITENDRLKTENETIMMDNNRLKMTNESVLTENDRLKTENASIVLDNNRLKIETVVKDNSGLQNEHITTESDNAGGIQKVVESIIENQTNLKSASAPEIIKKSIPKLHYTAEVSVSENGHVCYSVNIKRGEGIQDYKELLFVQGYGGSKKIAKIEAFENLIENILKHKVGLSKE